MENLKLNNGLVVVNYSEKSVAFFGNTKDNKDWLKDIGAFYNRSLTYQDVTTAGWIMAKKTYDKLDLSSFSIKDDVVIEPKVIIETPKVEKPKVEEPKVIVETPKEFDKEIPKAGDEISFLVDGHVVMATVKEKKSLLYVVVDGDVFELDELNDIRIVCSKDVWSSSKPKVEEPKVFVCTIPKYVWASSNKTKKEPKVEEPKVEEPKVEEPKVEEPKVEEPKVKKEIDKAKKEAATIESKKISSNFKWK